MKTPARECTPDAATWPTEQASANHIDDDPLEVLADRSIYDESDVVIRGPSLPAGAVEVTELFNPDHEGAYRGEAQVRRQHPFLPRLGHYDSGTIGQPLLERMWQSSEYGYRGYDFLPRVGEFTEFGVRQAIGYPNRLRAHYRAVRMGRPLAGGAVRSSLAKSARIRAGQCPRVTAFMYGEDDWTQYFMHYYQDASRRRGGGGWPWRPDFYVQPNMRVRDTDRAVVRDQAVEDYLIDFINDLGEVELGEITRLHRRLTSGYLGFYGVVRNEIEQQIEDLESLPPTAANLAEIARLQGDRDLVEERIAELNLFRSMFNEIDQDLIPLVPRWEVGHVAKPPRSPSEMTQDSRTPAPREPASPEAAAPSQLSHISKRWTSWATNLLATGVILIAGLTFGGRAIQWMWADAPSASDLAMRTVGDPAANAGQRERVLNFGDQPIQMRTSTMAGPAHDVIETLRKRTKEIVCTATPLDSDPGPAVTRWLRTVRPENLLEEQPGVWQIYGQAEPIPVVIGVRELEASEQEGAKQQQVAGDRRRVVSWSLAFPKGPADENRPTIWSLFTFVRGQGTTTGQSFDLPMPTGCVRTMSVGDGGPTTLIGFRGNTDPNQVSLHFDQLADDRSWERQGDWEQRSDRWRGCVETGDSGTIHVAFSGGNEMSDGMIMIVQPTVAAGERSQ